jgi:hypothetical protein
LGIWLSFRDAEGSRHGASENTRHGSPNRPGGFRSAVF